jgi:hypothetical protein
MYFSFPRLCSPGSQREAGGTLRFGATYVITLFLTLACHVVCDVGLYQLYTNFTNNMTCWQEDLGNSFGQ